MGCEVGLLPVASVATVFLCLYSSRFGCMICLNSKLWGHGGFPTIASIYLA